MIKNKKAPARSKADDEYLMTTKLVCGSCGCFMVGESGTSGTGAVHYYYKFGSSKRNKGCKKKAVKKDWIERLIVFWTVNRILRDEEIEKIADKLVALQDRENDLIPTLRQQLSEVEKALENLVTAIQQGLLSKTTKKRLDDLEAQKEDLEISILQAEIKRPKYSKEMIVEWIGQFKYGDIENRDYQRKLIDIFVNSITLFDDYLVFTYNYKDDTEQISIKDIEAALSSDFMSGSPPKTSLWLIATGLLHKHTQREKSAHPKAKKEVADSSFIQFHNHRPKAGNFHF